MKIAFVGKTDYSRLLTFDSRRRNGEAWTRKRTGKDDGFRPRGSRLTRYGTVGCRRSYWNSIERFRFHSSRIVSFFFSLKGVSVKIVNYEKKNCLKSLIILEIFNWKALLSDFGKDNAREKCIDQENKEIKFSRFRNFFEWKSSFLFNRLCIPYDSLFKDDR